MSAELDLRDVHRPHEPDPTFVAALERQLDAILAGDASVGDIAGPDADVDVSVVALPTVPRRSVLPVVLGAAAAVVLVAALGVVSWRQKGPGNLTTVGDRPTATVDAPSPAPPGPFVGIWLSTDTDGSSQTMEIVRSNGDEHEVVVRDQAATGACSGAPSTMTGTGRLETDGTLVIVQPELTCDDGTTPAIGPPPQGELANFTFVRDPDNDELVDKFGVVWRREGATTTETAPTMSGDITTETDLATSGGMWPQSSLEEVQEAQRLADAGDSGYTWQVDPGLHLGDGPGGSEIFARFLREELGWEEFRCCFFSGEFPSEDDGGYDGFGFVRCAPGGTNPLYQDSEDIRGCAPTIDDLRHEWVRISAAQLDRRGAGGIWVVTGWEMGQPVEQVVPPSDAEATALLQAFLGARVDGEGAEEYLHVPANQEIPLLYATTIGAPFEQFEFAAEYGPVWPPGEMVFTVRLFAEGGQTVVEQAFRMNRDGTGRLGLEYIGRGERSHPAPTTENGQALPEPYSFLDGEVTFAAPWPWGYFGSPGQSPTMTTLVWGEYDLDDEGLVVLADPLPVGTGCPTGPAPADAEELARIIRSDPDLEATEPVTVRIGGIDALTMDVVVAQGASSCDWWPHTHIRNADRMRLHLLDVPEGSARILAIAIFGTEAHFEDVVEAAAPILDSFEFHSG